MRTNDSRFPLISEALARGAVIRQIVETWDEYDWDYLYEVDGHLQSERQPEFEKLFVELFAADDTHALEWKEESTFFQDPMTLVGFSEARS